MYLTVDLKNNSIIMKHWQIIKGKRVKISVELKAYNENGRAAEVLRKSRERGLSVEDVITRIVGKNNMEKLFKRINS